MPRRGFVSKYFCRIRGWPSGAVTLVQIPCTTSTSLEILSRILLRVGCMLLIPSIPRKNTYHWSWQLTVTSGMGSIDATKDQSKIRNRRPRAECRYPPRVRINVSFEDLHTCKKVGPANPYPWCRGGASFTTQRFEGLYLPTQTVGVRAKVGRKGVLLSF